jgi:subtilisin family serine protease
VTPDFTPQQTYLDKDPGMNVRAAWQAQATGRGATIRHLDLGVYRHHEDLGNINVVHSRAETHDCNHGTASTGCIAATRNDIGVTGIAYDGRFSFYDTGDLDMIVRDAQEGDIIGVNLEYVMKIGKVPVIDNKSWWDKIRTLHDIGATVIVAAANGGLDLGKKGVINDWGDSGSMLAGACSPTTGRRTGFSNYGHRTSLVNSWGWSVVTTGYGTLQKRPGNDRNYTNSFSGTSSATPLVVGALAALQGYALIKHSRVLRSEDIRTILADTGYQQGVQDQIGHRPDLESAIRAIDTLTSDLAIASTGP